MSPWLLAFLIFDAIVTVAVIALVLRRRVVVGAAIAKSLPSRAAFQAMTAFAREKEERIVEAVRANWSGAPEHLPSVLSNLVDQLQREALERDVPIDREILKTLVETTVQRHRLGRSGDVRKAMSAVA